MLKKISPYVTAIILTVATSSAFAQVATNSGQKVNSILSMFLYLLTGAALTLFTAALVTVGYKFAYVEGTKLADLKGVVIGGVLFGIAGSVAAYLVSA